MDASESPMELEPEPPNTSNPMELESEPSKIAKVIEGSIRSQLALSNQESGGSKGSLSLFENDLRKKMEEEARRVIDHVMRDVRYKIEISGSRNLQLQFLSNLPETVFTNERIMAEDSNPVKFALYDSASKQIVTSGPYSSVKVDIVILDSDFLPDYGKVSKKDFDSKIVRNREGKRPLVTGELVVSLQDGVGYIGDISFTDNSSWIRSGKFRLGVKVHSGFNETSVREGISNAFRVKDHRGESYQKHYPPSLDDEVWRLQKIAKAGVSHKRLAEFGISCVRDFLRSYTTSPLALRSVLNISNKRWKTIIEHATTCILDDKKYIYRTSQGIGLLFNSIYQVVGVTLDGHNYHSVHSLDDHTMRMVEDLKQQAYRNLNDLENYEVGPIIYPQDANLQAVQGQLEMQMNTCHPSQNIMTEEVIVGPFYQQALEEERCGEDVLLGHFHVEPAASEGPIEEINDEAKSEVPVDMVLHDERYLNDFMLFCSMFPSDYEFTKDLLVCLWIAGGLIELAEDEIMEEVCVKCFNTLLSMDYIVASRYDHFVDQMKYRIGDKMTTFLQEQPLEPKFQKYLDSRQNGMVEVEHLSLACEEIDSVKFEVLKQYSRLQTLIIHHCYGFEGNHLPSDLFLRLKALKILNLSHTNIVELPSSVEILEELQYLDMSGTPISWLPETICCFRNLHTLNLDGCLSLRGLPKSTSKLINLRHLLLDVVRQLQSMPNEIGKLSKLRTLSAFLVGDDDGCGIGELKDMNELRGSFRILNLENVKTKEEAAEACLSNKEGLTKIELQWSDLRDEKNPHEEEILELLQPPFGIQELKILFYNGGVLPSWIDNPSFSELVRIVLHRCRDFCSLPSLGELPSLKLLSIIENDEVVEINSFFCRKQINQHQVAFPKLEKLSFDSMSQLEKWTGLENGDFPSLRHLVIECCPKFVGLPSLSYMKSPLHLEISYCPELSCLPEDGLPSTLESLMVEDCPKLKDRCCNELCEDWSKVSRVPFFCIDNQKISPLL